LPIIGIAKRLEEIYYPGDSVPLYIDKNSETLKLIQKLRDEAHRFGITHHREKRTKEMLKSELDGVKGIGQKTKDLLLEKYKSIEVIKSLDITQLEELIGKKKATDLMNYFNSLLVYSKFTDSEFFLLAAIIPTFNSKPIITDAQL